MPVTSRVVKGKKEQEEDEAAGEAAQRLVYEYLVAENMADTAKSFLKEAGRDAKQLKLGEAEDSLMAVVSSHLTENKRANKRAELFPSEEDSGDAKAENGNSEAAKKKRKRAVAGKRESGASEGGDGALVMKEESQKQYTFGWKRYTDYCQIHSLNPLVGDKASPANQILEFARYLMQNPAKSVKAAVANSYVSAVGKKLLEANVIVAMRDIRTPELKELFAEAGRTALHSNSSSSSAATTIATAANSVAAAKSIAEVEDTSDSQDVKKKKRV